MTDRDRADALAAVAVSRRLVAITSEACSGDIAVMLAALTGALVVVAGARGPEKQDEFLGHVTDMLELARGRLGVSVRTIVLDGGTPS